ncbi:hypothetical protein NYV32_23865 [Escherichia coli]|uniref:hypothetical protein n=1 Tax=Escherichia coli TaxID=562 RepID=UPI0022373BAB|nr:hypothetical protein [Escherichia coli]MCW6985394.1 hypothetical protein [Escherichia coli]
MRGAAPAALPARLSGQKVVYGCMQGTGVIFRDTAVSGCLWPAPAASGRRPTSCWRTRQSGRSAGSATSETGLQRPFRSRRPVAP